MKTNPLKSKLAVGTKKSMKRNGRRVAGVVFLVGLALLVSSPATTAQKFSEWSAHGNLGQEVNSAFEQVLPEIPDSMSGSRRHREWHAEKPDQVLEWNQIFIDTLIATNTANSSSQRLGAIVHTAIFDAFNGIQQRYTPIFVHDRAPDGASRRGAVIAAAYTALVGLFPSQQPALDASYAASVAALSDECDDKTPTRSHRRWQACVSRIERGIATGQPRRFSSAISAADDRRSH
jgi:hypothetical protein